MTAGIIALLFGVTGFILNTSSSRVKGPNPAMAVEERRRIVLYLLGSVLDGVRIPLNLYDERCNMKKYVHTAMITSGSADNFNERLASTIEDFQNHGCEVEVQYQTVFRKSSEYFLYTALVLAYRKENES